MGFYELGNGCDSCDTVQSILPNNVNMQMDPNSSLVASMVMPYGTQSNMVRQYNGAIASGYTTQGSNFGSMGMGSSGSTMGGNGTPQAMVMVPATTVAAPSTTVATTTGKQVQVAAPGSVAVVVPATNSAASTNTNKIEGFSDSTTSSSGWMQDSRKWVVLGLVIFAALAANECCKYFLNKSLQLNDGSPLYYVGYVVMAILLAWAAETYIAKN